MSYVVYGCEHLRDGIEEWAKVVDSIEAALAIVNKDYFAKDNMTFRIFELGKEIRITQKETKEPQPLKVTKRYVVKGK